MAVVKPEIKTTEYEMFSRYRETGDIALRDEIVSSYIYIAEILSRKFINRGVEYDDIFQVACMGILYAVERFDPDKGVKFATYATPTVMGEIRKYFRDKGNFIRIPRRLYEIFYKAEKIKRVSSEISQEEIARILNIPEKLLENVYEVGDTSFIKSLEYEAYADGELNFSNLIGIEDSNFLMIEDKDFIKYCMSRLSADERKFIEYRYYDEKSQKEISEIKEKIMEDYKKEFIEFMMESDVLRFGDFVTKSGRNTPYFVNTGNFRTGKQIATLGKFYAALIKENCGDNFDCMFGPAYKGIPLATAAAGALYNEYKIDKPYFFNRKEEKDHGEGGSLVGYKPQDGDKVIIIEDVITAGTAVRETMPILKNAANVEVKDMFISVNRCEVGQNPEKTTIMEVMEDFGINVHAIITVQDIYEYLKQDGSYGDILTKMKEYMDTYCVF